MAFPALTANLPRQSAAEKESSAMKSAPIDDKAFSAGRYDDAARLWNELSPSARNDALHGLQRFLSQGVHVEGREYGIP